MAHSKAQVFRLNAQEKKQTSGKKNEVLEHQDSELPEISKDNAKRDASEPLYLLRYE